MEIKRDRYLKQLIDNMWDGQVKVITGIRRCGKSYLLKILFKNYLIQKEGVRADNIIDISLDLTSGLRFRDPLYLVKYVKKILSGKNERFYLFIDEIQMSESVENPYVPTGNPITFYDALNDLRAILNLDIYVTGSNSKMLANDVLTEFRGRSDEIRVHPLSFSEFLSAYDGTPENAMNEYSYYGGMPFLFSRKTEEAKSSYLKSLVSEVYLRDIVERHHVTREDVLSMLFDVLCSSVGSLTNPNKLTKTLQSLSFSGLSVNTVGQYIMYLKDAFMFSEAKRYDVKGKSYFDYPYKYYCEDIGLRNARLEFRQQEMTHIMENIIYNELILRGYSVDVGVVCSNERKSDGSYHRVNRQIDFIATHHDKKTYIQSSFSLDNEEKTSNKLRPLSLTGDSFQKIIVRMDVGKPWYNESGILNVKFTDFLLDESFMA